MISPDRERKITFHRPLARAAWKQGGWLCRLAGVTCLLFFTFACGYRFQGEATLPGGAQRLCVEIFENRTNIAGLEAMVTNGLVFEFSKRSRIRLVSDASRADAVLRGVIQSVESKTVASRNKDGAGERSLTLTLGVRLVQPSGKVLWSADRLSDSEVYVVSEDKISDDEKKIATLGVLAHRIAEKIHNRFTDDF